MGKWYRAPGPGVADSWAAEASWMAGKVLEYRVEEVCGLW